MFSKWGKKSYVSHEVIAVLELMQNEVNETITAVLDYTIFIAIARNLFN